MRTYRLIVYREYEKSDTIEWRGYELTKDHPTFVKTEEVLNIHELFDMGIACKEVDYELPERDLKGKKIVVHNNKEEVKNAK